MNTLLVILLFVLGIAILYLLLSQKLNKLVSSYFNTEYRNQMQSDIQAFYREMENYAVLFENKINQFKKLLEESQKKSFSSASITSITHKEKKKQEKSQPFISNKKKIDMDLKEKPLAKLHTPEKKIPVLNAKKRWVKDVTSSLPSSVAEEVAPSSVAEEVAPSSVAEEVAPSSVAEEITKNVLNKEAFNINAATHIQNHVEKPPKKSFPLSEKVFSFLGNLGRSVLGSKHVNLVENKITESFNHMLDSSLSKVQEKKDTYHLPKKPFQTDKNQKPIVSRDQQNSPSNVIIPKAKETQEANNEDLDVTLLLDFVEDLKNSKTRPKALEQLLSHGFNLDNIAEMSELPLSLLQATKNMYQL